MGESDMTRSSKFGVPKTSNFGPRTLPGLVGIDRSSVLDSLLPMAFSQAHSLFPAADLRFTFHASRFMLPLYSILLALVCLAGTACSTTAPTGKILFDDARGTVSLQTISDQSIKANHPINLEPALLSQLLTGMELQDRGGGEHNVRGLQTLIEGNAALIFPVFSDDQVQFLAPLIAEGLRTANANQSVEFRVVTTIPGSNRFESSTTETTLGSLYAYGRQLYVILTQYNYNPMQTNLNFAEQTHRSQDPLDYSGLKHRTLRFTPKAALRTDSPDPPTMGKPTDRFIAVDYQLLQQAWRNLEAKKHAAPQVDGSVEAVRAAEDRARTAEAQARNTEALSQEVETLKKQLESIQKQLGNQPTGQSSQNQKTTPPAK